MPDHDRRWALLLLIPMLMSLSVGAALRTPANAEGGAAEPRPGEAYASYDPQTTWPAGLSDRRLAQLVA